MPLARGGADKPSNMQWLTIPADKEKDWWELVKAHLKARAQALFPRVAVTLKTAGALLIQEAGSITNKGAECVEKSLLLESSIEKV